MPGRLINVEGRTKTMKEQVKITGELKLDVPPHSHDFDSFPQIFFIFSNFMFWYCWTNLTCFTNDHGLFYELNADGLFVC